MGVFLGILMAGFICMDNGVRSGSDMNDSTF